MKRLAAVTCAFFLARLALSQGDVSTLDRITEEGKHHSQVMSILRTISVDIGARLTGSPALARGQQWAIGQFKKWGLNNVHLEQWGEVPVGFDRGPLQTARMVEPFDVPMEFTTPAWTNGTRGLIKGEAVKCPVTLDDLKKVESQLAGKWVVFPPRSGAKPVVQPPPEVLDALEKLAIAGRVYPSRTELNITFGSWNKKTIKMHPGSPQVYVRKSDYDRIQRNFDFGRKVVLEIGAENRWFAGPIKQYNVVAEIPGTERPDEVVIVSGHFDSWNGPGSQGALDNGTGSATAMEAARILMAAGAKPKRTIRFILWSGEEQGLFGSIDYVKQHKAELDKISAVLVDDGGTNYQGGYECTALMKPILDAAVAPSLKAFPEFPQSISVIDKMPLGGGSDHAPFNQAGVPGFYTKETGRADYNYVHHTQFDRFEMAIPEYLVQSGTNHAIVSFNLACADSLVPRSPK